MPRDQAEPASGRRTRSSQEYLNTVYYGNHAYGVEAAAQTYFSQARVRAHLRQSALLAGLPQAPSVYDPIHNPSRGDHAAQRGARERCSQNGSITRGAVPLGLARGRSNLKPGNLYTRIQQPYFFSYVFERARARVRREHGARRRAAGVHDHRPAASAGRAQTIRQTLDEHDDPAAAIVSIEPGTGTIRAMTSVIPGNTTNQFNLAAQSTRQSGSTFKSFVLAAAIEQGIDPDHTYYTSAQFTCTSGPWCEGDYKAGKPWQVTTYDHSYIGSTSITHATLRSDNTVYAQLTLDVGPDHVWRMASGSVST